MPESRTRLNDSALISHLCAVFCWSNQYTHAHGVWILAKRKLVKGERTDDMSGRGGGEGWSPPSAFLCLWPCFDFAPSILSPFIHSLVITCH
jgi:hypothetical protein